MATKTKDMNPIANAYEGGDVVRLTKGMTAKARGGGTTQVKKGSIGTVMFQARKDSALVAFKGPIQPRCRCPTLSWRWAMTRA